MIGRTSGMRKWKPQQKTRSGLGIFTDLGQGRAGYKTCQGRENKQTPDPEGDS